MPVSLDGGDAQGIAIPEVDRHGELPAHVPRRLDARDEGGPGPGHEGLERLVRRARRSLVDGGNPISQAKAISPDGSVMDATSAPSGYSILKADSLDACRRAGQGLPGACRWRDRPRLGDVPGHVARRPLRWACAPGRPWHSCLVRPRDPMSGRAGSIDLVMNSRHAGSTMRAMPDDDRATTSGGRC